MEDGTMRGRGRGQKRPKETVPDDGVKVTGGEEVQGQGNGDERKEGTVQ